MTPSPRLLVPVRASSVGPDDPATERSALDVELGAVLAPVDRGEDAVEDRVAFVGDGPLEVGDAACVVDVEGAVVVLLDGGDVTVVDVDVVPEVDDVVLVLLLLGLVDDDVLLLDVVVLVVLDDGVLPSWQNWPALAMKSDRPSLVVCLGLPSRKCAALCETSMTFHPWPYSPLPSTGWQMRSLVGRAPSPAVATTAALVPTTVVSASATAARRMVMVCMGFLSLGDLSHGM